VATQVFLLTDIEGSTRRWAGRPTAMADALEAHDRLIAEAVDLRGGVRFKHTGDGWFVVFDLAADAVEAAFAAQRSLTATDWGEVGGLAVRMAAHAGPAARRGHDWFGPALNRTARLTGLAHGGQLLVSDVVRGLLADGRPASITLVDRGVHRPRDLVEPEHVWQVAAGGLRLEFPPLRSSAPVRGNLPVPVTSYTAGPPTSPSWTASWPRAGW
jgi:class 3 adenylate cyclase